jgi:hypothetical protein
MKTITAIAVFMILVLSPLSAQAYGYYSSRPVIRYKPGFYTAPYNSITYQYYAPVYPGRYNDITSYPTFNGSYIPNVYSYIGDNSYAGNYGGNTYANNGYYNGGQYTSGGVMVIN